MPGGTRLTKCLSQPSCTPACTPRRAWVFGSGATGCEEVQPIAVVAGPSEGNAAGASWADLAFASFRSDSAVAFRPFATSAGCGCILLDAAQPIARALQMRKMQARRSVPTRRFWMRRTNERTNEYR